MLRSPNTHIVYAGTSESITWHAKVFVLLYFIIRVRGLFFFLNLDLSTLGGPVGPLKVGRAISVFLRSGKPERRRLGSFSVV